MTYEEYKKLHPEDAENIAREFQINLNNNTQNLNNTNTNQQPPQKKDAEKTTPKSIIPKTIISKTFFNKHWFTKTNISGKYIIVKDNLKSGLKSLSVLNKNNLGILPFHFTIPCFTSVATLYKECDYDYIKHKYPINTNGKLECEADFKLRISIINPINFISTGNENDIIEAKIEHDFDSIVYGYFNKLKINVTTGAIYETNSDDEEFIKDPSIIADEIKDLLKKERKFYPSQERLEMEEEKINNNNNYTNEEKINLIKKLNEIPLTFEEYYGIRVNTLSLDYFRKPAISEENEKELVKQASELQIQELKNEQMRKKADAEAYAKRIIDQADFDAFKQKLNEKTKDYIKRLNAGLNADNVININVPSEDITNLGLYTGATPILNQGQVQNENNDKQNSNTQNKNSNQKEILNDIRLILINKDIPEELKIKKITEKYNLSQEDLQELLQTLQNSNENETHKTK